LAIRPAGFVVRLGGASGRCIRGVSVKIGDRKGRGAVGDESKGINSVASAAVRPTPQLRQYIVSGKCFL
jgi:hypothetical protein